MKHLFLIGAVAALLSGASCSKQESPDTPTPVRFRIAAIAAASRAAADYPAADYFTLPGLEQATVAVKTLTATYVYADNTLAGATEEDILHFPVDGSALPSVKVRWPDDAARQASGQAPAKDQRSKEVFLAADWLSAELKDVAPAQTIALTLMHERPKVTFTLVGAMAGRKITALSVGGYEAYCDADTRIKDAQLMMPADNGDIAPEAIGALTLEGETSPRSFVIKTMPALIAGQNHTIEINL